MFGLTRAFPYVIASASLLRAKKPAQKLIIGVPGLNRSEFSEYASGVDFGEASGFGGLECISKVTFIVIWAEATERQSDGTYLG